MFFYKEVPCKEISKAGFQIKVLLFLIHNNDQLVVILQMKDLTNGCNKLLYKYDNN